MRGFLAITCTALVALLGVSAASSRSEPIRAVRHDGAKSSKQVKSVEQRRAQAAQLQRAAKKVAAFRATTWGCQDALGMKRTRAEIWVWDLPESIPYRNWVLKQWQRKASSCQKVLDHRTLPSSNDWQTSVGIVQRVFPGTQSWLLSCSAAEGGHGEWVTYGHGHYYPGFEHRYVVGGPMQYKWPTFKGHYRHALDALHSKGFIVNLPPPEDVKAWLSMTAQALAAGWARWAGEDNSHWSASWSNGC